MSPKLAAEQVRIAGLMLGSVDALLRAMLADGVPDPVATMRLLLVRIEDDEVGRRYGAMVRGLRATYTYRNNRTLVERALADCVSTVSSLL